MRKQQTNNKFWENKEFLEWLAKNLLVTNNRGQQSGPHRFIVLIEDSWQKSRLQEQTHRQPVSEDALHDDALVLLIQHGKAHGQESLSDTTISVLWQNSPEANGSIAVLSIVVVPGGDRANNVLCVVDSEDHSLWNVGFFGCKVFLKVFQGLIEGLEGLALPLAVGPQSLVALLVETERNISRTRMHEWLGIWVDLHAHLVVVIPWEIVFVAHLVEGGRENRK